ncbi:MAG: Crp/Fnr family transcriptional regulator, partial [Patescibacteria group bacterium]
MTPQQKLDQFFSQYKLRYYKKGETFLRAGDIPQGIFFLKKGYARLYSLSSAGKELTLVIYKPGEFFPVVFTFTAKPSIYYFETLSEVEMIRAPRENFASFIRENPDVFDEVNLHIIERFQIALRRMEYLTFGNANSRLASILLICARYFGVRSDHKEIKIPIPFTHKDIANLVGVARETVSIELKKFID